MNEEKTRKELIDYYVDRYAEERKHKTDRYIRGGMLAGLGWICRFYNISDEDIGEENWAKITGVSRKI